jgi:hypothetical protein
VLSSDTIFFDDRKVERVMVSHEWAARGKLTRAAVSEATRGFRRLVSLEALHASSADSTREKFSGQFRGFTLKAIYLA